MSGAARALETAGFIRRSRRRGDRRQYFSIPAGAIRSLRAGAGLYHRMTVIASHGIGVVADLPPPSRSASRVPRLRGLRRQVSPTFLQQYVAERDSRKDYMPSISAPSA